MRRIGRDRVAQIAPILTRLALIPYFIAVLGLDGFSAGHGGRFSQEDLRRW